MTNDHLEAKCVGRTYAGKLSPTRTALTNKVRAVRYRRQFWYDPKSKSSSATAWLPPNS